MGRFYKTASPQMVDFMYKIPEQALLKAIEGVDKQIDTQYLYKTEAEKLLQKKALSPDEQRQREILEGHQKEIDEVSQLLSTSPLAALKDSQRIRNLQSKIYQDVTRGELAAQYKNYDIRQKHLEEETKRATDQDGNIRVEDLNEAMRRFDEAFAKGEVDDQGNIIKSGGTAYDPTTKTYRSYSPEKLVNYFDITEEAKKQSEGWEPDVNTDITRQYLDKSGNYIVTDKQGREILKKDDLTFGIYNILTNNPEVTNQRNQMIRIRSGAKPGTEEYLKEWEKVYGVRQVRGNLGSPFAMETVMQTVTDPTTGKTETKPLTRKVQKFDEEGNPIEGQFEEKEIKRMVNPGEIFAISQAAADRKDKNKIVSSITQDETEAYKVGLQQQKEIAVAKAKAAEEEKRKALEKVTFSNNNAEVKDIIITQKNNKEAREALNNMKSNTIKSVTDKGAELIKVIENSGRSKEEQRKLTEQLRNIMKPLEAGAQNLIPLDFSALKNFLAQNNITGVGDVATGIDGLSQSYNQSAIDYKNKNEHYMALYNISKPKNFDDSEKELDKLKAEYEESVRIKGTSDYRTKAIEKKYMEAKEKHQKLINTWNKDFDAKLDYNNKDGANSNTKTIFSSGGSELEKVLPQNIFTGFVNALTSITAGNLFPHLLSGTNSVVVTQGKSEPISFNKLLENNNINAELFSTLKDGEKIQIEGGKTMTINLGSTRVVPGNANFMVKDDKGQIQERKIGRGSLQVTLTIYNPKTEKTEISEIYIPKDEVSNNNLRVGSDYLEKHYEPNDIKNEAKTQFGALSNQQNWTEDQKENYKFTFNGGVYYPHKDKWVFDNNPKVPLYEEAALEYYRNIKGYK